MRIAPGSKRSDVLNVDSENARLVERVRQLEHVLDDALRALDAQATMREREYACTQIRESLKTRRTLQRA